MGVGGIRVWGWEGLGCGGGRDRVDGRDKVWRWEG